MKKYRSQESKLAYVRKHLNEMTKAEFAAEFGVSEVTAHNLIVKVRKGLGQYVKQQSAEKQQRIEALRGLPRMTTREVATMYGIGVSVAVEYVREVWGLPPKPEPVQNEDDPLCHPLDHKYSPKQKPIYCPFRPERKPLMFDNFGGAF